MEINKKIYTTLSSVEKVLLHLHPWPDPDSAGSALACMHVLEGMGKEVVVISGDSPLPRSFLALPGAEKIVEKHYEEVDIESFDAFVILDSSNKGHISNKSEVDFPEIITTIVIDHHTSNQKFGSINFVDTEAAATAQILFELFVDWGVEITPDVALNLLAGIYFDTSFFTTPLTTPRSVEIFSHLVKKVPDFYKTISAIKNSRAKKEVVAEALVVSKVKDYCSGSVGIAAVSHDALKEYGINFAEFSGKIYSSSLLRSAPGWHIVATVVEEEPKKTKVSMRTLCDDKYDLSTVAEKLGGGGHPGAAGALLNMPAEEVKEKVLKTVRETFPHLECS